MKTENVDNLVEQIEVQGKLTSIRSYTVGDHLEFRFPYADPATGRRRFKCCRRLEDAKDAARQIGVTKPSTRAETQTAVVEAAVRRAVAEAFHKAAAATGPAVQTLPFSEVASRFLTDKETAMTRGELRYASYRDLLTRTEHLKKALGGVSTSNLTVSVLDEAIRSLPAKSPRSVWNYRATLRSILIWARDRNLAPANIIRSIRGMSAKGDPKKDAEKIDPFSADEVEVILHACLEHRRNSDRNTRLAAACALQAFCGLRARESCILDWSSVELRAGVIRVKADGSKVRTNRTIKLTDNAKAWLELVPVQSRRGRVYGGNYWDSMAGAQKRARVSMPGFRWRHNGLRSSFISHYIAWTDSITETAQRAGNSEAKIRSNYWALKTKDEAVRYFNIMPESSPDVSRRAEECSWDI